MSGMPHPKTRLKCQAPLLKMTGVISGVVTPKEKTSYAMPPFYKEKNNKNDKQTYSPGDIGGVVVL